MNKQKIKPYGIALLLVVLYAIDIFWLSDIIGARMGLWGSISGELLLVIIAAGVFLIFHGKMKVIFPFKKPEAAKIAGTIILWMGAYTGVMIVSMLIACIFPEKMLSSSEGIQEAIDTLPALLSLLIIAVSPAICEEIAFRGALLSCFRGLKNRWAAIIIVSVIFGAFHGSIWRMIPTMLLGIVMGYLLFETENMFYNMLMHFVNNAFPIILMAVLNAAMALSGEEVTEMAEAASYSAGEAFVSLAVYLMIGGGAPLLIYLGNYLLHSGQPGYDRGVFTGEKKRSLVILIAIGIGMMILGLVMFLTAIMLFGITGQ